MSELWILLSWSLPSVQITLDLERICQYFTSVRSDRLVYGNSFWAITAMKGLEEALDEATQFLRK